MNWDTLKSPYIEFIIAAGCYYNISTAFAHIYMHRAFNKNRNNGYNHYFVSVTHAKYVYSSLVYSLITTTPSTYAHYRSLCWPVSAGEKWNDRFIETNKSIRWLWIHRIFDRLRARLAGWLADWLALGTLFDFKIGKPFPCLIWKWQCVAVTACNTNFVVLLLLSLLRCFAISMT